MNIARKTYDAMGEEVFIKYLNGLDNDEVELLLDEDQINFEYVGSIEDYFSDDEILVAVITDLLTYEIAEVKYVESAKELVEVLKIAENVAYDLGKKPTRIENLKVGTHFVAWHKNGDVSYVGYRELGEAEGWTLSGVDAYFDGRELMEALSYSDSVKFYYGEKEVETV